MMTYKLFLGLIGIFVVAPTILFFSLRWVLLRFLRPKFSSYVSVAITPVGFVYYGALVLALVIGVASYKLDPNGALSSFLERPSGIFIGSLLLAGYLFGVDWICRRLGYPVIRTIRRDV